MCARKGIKIVYEKPYEKVEPASKNASLNIDYDIILDTLINRMRSRSRVISPLTNELANPSIDELASFRGNFGNCDINTLVGSKIRLHPQTINKLKSFEGNIHNSSIECPTCAENNNKIRSLSYKLWQKYGST